MIDLTWVHSVAQNDLAIINLSSFKDYRQDILEPYCIREAQLFPAVYDDAIYQPLEVNLVSGADLL